MNSSLVSIVIPVYNVEKYIAKCLQSIIDQTHKNIEVIVVNDGSPDDSHLIIKEFSEKDCRVKLYNQSNAGLSAARNTGVANSVGEYIMFVDSDDWIDETLVEKLLLKINTADLVICSYNRSYEHIKIPRVFTIEGQTSGELFQRRLVGMIENELSDPTQADSFSIACGKLYKVNIIKDNRIAFISTKKIGTEDLLFNIQYCNHIQSCFILNQPLYYYRRDNDTSLTSTHKPKLFSQWLTLFDIIQNIIADKNTCFEKAFKNRICLSIVGLGLNEMQNPRGFSERYKNINNILISQKYKEAYSNLNLKHFPVHWRIFFAFAKYRFTLGLYMMLVVISYSINKNN